MLDIQYLCFPPAQLFAWGQLSQINPENCGKHRDSPPSIVCIIKKNQLGLFHWHFRLRRVNPCCADLRNHYQFKHDRLCCAAPIQFSSGLRLCLAATRLISSNKLVSCTDPEYHREEDIFQSLDLHVCCILFHILGFVFLSSLLYYYFFFRIYLLITICHLCSWVSKQNTFTRVYLYNESDNKHLISWKLLTEYLWFKVKFLSWVPVQTSALIHHYIMVAFSRSWSRAESNLLMKTKLLLNLLLRNKSF